MAITPPVHPNQRPFYVYGLRECPGGCGREDVDERVFACSVCLERLPAKVHEALIEGGPGLLPALARAKIFFDNVTPHPVSGM